MKNFRRLGLLAPLAIVLYNLLIAYFIYFIARIAYLLVNYHYFSQYLTLKHLMELFGGGLVFDTAAILVTNIPYVLLILLPWHRKEEPTYQLVARWGYMLINGAALAINLCDSVYFQYTMRRTTTTVFSEFSNEGNLGSIFFTETLHHFSLVLLFIVVMWGVWRLYRDSGLQHEELCWWKYTFATLLSLCAIAPFIVAGIRGGFATAVRPITISNANQYVNRPIEAALVLNTPFSLYRTIGKDVFVVPQYFNSEKEMARVFTPIHTIVPIDTIVPIEKKNVVILIVESFGCEYIGALNKTLENSQYKGYTPYVDALIGKSTTFRYSYCNGRKSIDGMPSVLSSIPMFVEPFILTPSSMNDYTGIAGILAAEGYETAFFHGAQNGSMGFQAFAQKTGFQRYFGRTEYEAAKGTDDFDGNWAIWDEPFLQFYAEQMSQMKEPFMTAVFTASSHHPYHIPEKYKEVYPEEGIIMHKCVRYTDMAIGKFFETASRQPWFKNTIFVMTSDHTNMTDHAEYQTDLGGFCSPIIIFDPSNPVGEMQDKIAQQIDILPTVLGKLGYSKPYFGFGIDVLKTPKEDTWAVNYLNGVYQYVKHGHVLQFDGQKTRGVYALTDSLMQHNLVGKVKEQKQMEKELKAIIQQYMERMTQDRLKP